MARQRLAGEICCMCMRYLGRPLNPGEWCCVRCGRHKVYFSYFHREGWTVQFLEPDLKMLIGKIMTFGDADRIRELIARTPTPMDLEARNMLEHSIENGRGGLYLELIIEQYDKLKH